MMLAGVCVRLTRLLLFLLHDMIPHEYGQDTTMRGVQFMWSWISESSGSTTSTLLNNHGDLPLASSLHIV